MEEPTPASDCGTEALVRTVKQNVERVAELGRTVQPEAGVGVAERGRARPHGGSGGGRISRSSWPTHRPSWKWTIRLQRLAKVNQALENEVGILEVQNRIQSPRQRGDVQRTQRDYYLREQLRQIRHELGDADSFRDRDRGPTPEDRRPADCQPRPAPKPTSSCGVSNR